MGRKENLPYVKHIQVSLNGKLATIMVFLEPH